MARKSSYFRLLCTASGALCALGAGACGRGGGADINIVIHAPPPLDSSNQCPGNSPFTPVARGPNGPTTLRLTYRRHGGTLVCDAVVPLEGEKHLVGVPKGMAGMPLGNIDLVVEAFRGDATQGAVLTASGQATNVDLGAGGDVHVFLAPRDSFGCTHGFAGRGRAFHSVTTLPSGEVLLVGGLVPSVNDPGKLEIDLANPVTTGGFYATDSVEIYDPQTASFRDVTVPGLTPRAFHHAYLIPGAEGDAPRVLLVGGLAPTGGAGTAPVADGVRDAAEPLRLVPSAQAMPAPTEVLTLTGPNDGTVAKLDGAAAFAPRMLEAGTRAPSPGDLVAVVPGAPLVAGGYEGYPTPFAGTYETADLSTVSSVGDATWTTNPAGRVGATATWIGPDRALVWGGNLGSPAGMETAQVGNLLAGLGGAAPTTSLVTFDAMGVQPAARAFHAAAAIDVNDVLIVGGYQVAGGSTGEPVSPFAERLTFPANDAVAVVQTVDAPGATAVGYLEATPMLGGDILVTGGNPALGALGTPCPDGTINFPLCATADVWRYHKESGSMAAVDKMKTPRWGHRVAVLADGTLLVTGGFMNAMTHLYVVRAAEVYNPRTEAEDAAADALGTLPARVPGDVARNMDGTAASPCTITDVP
jgi:hypothetical protein